MNVRNQKGFLPIIPAIIIGLVAVGGGVAAASQNSIPGDILYGLKNATEKVRVVLSFTSAEKAKTHLSITLERLEEIERLQGMKGPAQYISDAAKSLKEHQDAAVEDVTRSITEKGPNAAGLIDRLESNSEQQQNVLSNLLGKVPDAAKESIRHAAESSAKGLQRAQEAHKK